MGHLATQVALATDASRGIGRGIAHKLAAEGADVIASYCTHRKKAQQVAGATAAWAAGRRSSRPTISLAQRCASTEVLCWVCAWLEHRMTRLDSTDPE